MPEALPEIPDFVGLIRRASVSDEARPIAAEYFEGFMRDRNPLSADHGSHVLRPSSFGRCSLEFAAANLGLTDLTEADDQQLVMDTGSLLGLWLGCLLKAGAKAEAQPFAVMLEYPVEYRGIPGHIDALIDWRDYALREPIDFKTTPSTGSIKDPAERKPYQVLQVGGYALAPLILAPRFHVVTMGYQVGNDKSGAPHPKMVCHSYITDEWQLQVDAEIDRLTALTLVVKEQLLEMPELADATDSFRCRSCGYSQCERNLNPLAFAL